jgi:integrase
MLRAAVLALAAAVDVAQVPGHPGHDRAPTASAVDDLSRANAASHTARHTFATHWLKRGGRMETLSKAMGHASIAVTVDLYGHLDLSDVARDLALVEGHGISPLQREVL